MGRAPGRRFIPITEERTMSHSASGTGDGDRSPSVGLTGPVRPDASSMTAPAPNRSVRLLRPIAEPSEILTAQNEARDLVKKVLTEGRDYGVIQGTDRSTLLKPGAEKIALAFGCKYGEPQIVEKEINHEQRLAWTKRKKEWSGPRGNRTSRWVEESGISSGFYRYVIRRDVIDVETGRVVGHGIGACSTLESKYVDRPRDCENTVLKMASKRATVDACLTTFGMSDQFTQDVEDLPESERSGERANDHDSGAANNLPAITVESPWPNGVNKDTPINKLSSKFLLWAAKPDSKHGARTDELRAAVNVEIEQRKACKALGCVRERNNHDEKCALFVSSDPDEATTTTATPTAESPTAPAGDMSGASDMPDDPDTEDDLPI